MKIRSGFVSNSSDSSFIINLKNITPLQVTQIFDHINVGRELGIDYATPDGAWEIEVSDDGTKLSASTHMDNFDMEEFLQKIGVSKDVIQWDREW